MAWAQNILCRIFPILLVLALVLVHLQAVSPESFKCGPGLNTPGGKQNIYDSYEEWSKHWWMQINVLGISKYITSWKFIIISKEDSFKELEVEISVTIKNTCNLS